MNVVFYARGGMKRGGKNGNGERKGREGKGG